MLGVFSRCLMLNARSDFLFSYKHCHFGKRSKEIGPRKKIRGWHTKRQIQWTDKLGRFHTFSLSHSLYLSIYLSVSFSFYLCLLSLSSLSFCLSFSLSISPHFSFPFTLSGDFRRSMGAILSLHRCKSHTVSDYAVIKAEVLGEYVFCVGGTSLKGTESEGMRESGRKTKRERVKLAQSCGVCNLASGMWNCFGATFIALLTWICLSLATPEALAPSSFIFVFYFLSLTTLLDVSCFVQTRYPS